MIYELTGPRVLVKKELQVDPRSFDSLSVSAQTLVSAISTGTELAAWTGKAPLRPSTPYPRLVGYCNVARVQSVGGSIRDLSEGDIILTHQSHRSAFSCQVTDVLLNIGRADPSMQRLLATTYLYHLGYSALMEGGYRPGSEVAIVGFGALGFTTASLVSVYGGTPTIFSSKGNAQSFTEYIPHARIFGKSFGRDTRPSFGGLDGADIVINTSDSWSDYELCLDLVRRGGGIVLLGFPGRGLNLPSFNPLDSKYIYDKNITVRQAGHVPNLDVPPADFRFSLKRNLTHIFSLLKTGRMDPSPLCQSVFPWHDLRSTYEFLEQRPEGVLSALLDWSC